MRVLGLETSCDETAAAVVTEGGDVLSDVVHSQIAVHAPWGGVVPELAARDHLVNVMPVVQAALDQANVTLGDLDAIAVTVRPGLAGALLVGAQMAKTMAWASGKPLVGVDHLVGHLLAVFLRRGESTTPTVPAAFPAFPYVALLASGGHTAIYRVDGPLAAQIRELGATRDDAAGEAFDKVAKVLGLGYPGGPLVDRLAAQGNPKAYKLPRSMMNGSLEFSFSGIKTWVARHVASEGRPATDQAMADLCASFQSAVVEVLSRKVLLAAEQEGVRSIVLSGGVAANRGLRARTAELCAKAGLDLHVPPVASCTDNAAMIAYAGAMRFAAGERDDLSLTISTRTSLPRVTRKGRGERDDGVVRSPRRRLRGEEPHRTETTERGASMNAIEVGNKYVELLKDNNHQAILETLFAKDCVSVEAGGPPGMDRTSTGIEAIAGKGKWWTDNHIIHKAEHFGPYPHGDRFAVRFVYDITNKPSQKRMTMDEIGLFTVVDGKITREEFFYQMG